jgi:hypothetical protein
LLQLRPLLIRPIYFDMKPKQVAFSAINMDALANTLVRTSLGGVLGFKLSLSILSILVLFWTSLLFYSSAHVLHLFTRLYLFIIAPDSTGIRRIY